MDSLLEFIYNQCQVGSFYRQEKRFQELANLVKLKDISMNFKDKDFIQPLEFCNYLQRMIDAEKEEEEAEVGEKLKGNYGVVGETCIILIS